jgi:hypothetical protein
MRKLLEYIDAALAEGDPEFVGEGWEIYDSLVAIEKARKIIAEELSKKDANGEKDNPR